MASLSQVSFWSPLRCFVLGDVGGHPSKFSNSVGGFCGHRWVYQGLPTHAAFAPKPQQDISPALQRTGLCVASDEAGSEAQSWGGGEEGEVVMFLRSKS